MVTGKSFVFHSTSKFAWHTYASICPTQNDQQRSIGSKSSRQEERTKPNNVGTFGNPAENNAASMLEVFFHPITTAILLSIFSGDVTTSNASSNAFLMKFVGMSYRGKVKICVDPHLAFH